MNRTIYAENLVNKLSSTGESLKTDNCPRILLGQFLDRDDSNRVFTISGGAWLDISDHFSSNFPQFCMDTGTDFYNNEDSSGCCITPQDQNGTDSCKDGHSMGFIFNFQGVVAGDEPLLDGSYNICHKHPVQTMFNFLDDPNEFIKFFKLLLITLAGVLVLSIIATCYEFWLRYGNSIDCLYYIGKCKNIGDESKSGDPGKVNLIDYMFPNSICFYPYQKCETTSQSGGKKQKGGKSILDSLEEKERVGFHSNYVAYKEANGVTTKCITIDTSDYSKDERPFPYNIADFDTDSKSMKILLKFISFFILFPILITRKILNFMFTRLSSAYQNNIRNNVFLSNLIFALFLGVIPVNLGGITLLTLLIGFVGFVANPGLTAIYSLLIILKPSLLFKKEFARCENEDLNNYYRIFKLFGEDGFFYSIANETELKSKVKNILKNILTFFLFIFIAVFGFILGSISSSLAMIYLTVSTLFNFFYIPMSNGIEMLDIMKEHSGLLTILFCLAVVTSSAFSFDQTTTSIMTMFVVILILYKIMKIKK